MTSNHAIWQWQAQSEWTAGADVWVVYLSADAPCAIPQTWPAAISEAVTEMHKRGQWKAEVGDVSVLPVYGLAPVLAVALVGTGKQDRHIQVAAQSIREASAALVKALSKRQMGTVKIGFSESFATQSSGEALQEETACALACAIREGWTLGDYQAKSYAREAKASFVFSNVTVAMPAGLMLGSDAEQRIDKQWQRTGIISDAVLYARDFVNMPGNLLVPEGLAQAAEALAATHADVLSVDVLREQRLKELGMGALLAVGQASVNPPRMIVLRYQGNPNSTDQYAIVGKGITFDTGGISLKQAKGMEEMIGDMGGAAAVLGTMQAIAQLKPQVNVLAVIPTAENMPGGNAYKPGDVVTSYSKRTIEVLNTDAEGRVILADAITYAKELGATKLVDLATLTGAILISFAHEATGAVTNNTDLLKELQEASAQTGELIWQLPVLPAYKKMLKSDVADVKNATGPHAGSITAGLFLGTFAEHTPWVHLDIAGTSWRERPSGVDPKGGTGVMVRTLVQWLSEAGK